MDYLAIHAGFDQIIIEGDNKIVIQPLEGNIQIPRQIYDITKDIHIWRNLVVHVNTNWELCQDNEKHHFLSPPF